MTNHIIPTNPDIEDDRYTTACGELVPPPEEGDIPDCLPCMYVQHGYYRHMTLTTLDYIKELASRDEEDWEFFEKFLHLMSERNGLDAPHVEFSPEEREREANAE